jgi:gliding motility-associated-like protein
LTYIITATDQCDNEAKDSVLVDVIRNPLLTDTYGDTIICPFGEAVIGVNATSGTGDYRFEWDINEVTNEVMVSPSNSQYFYVNVYDSCNTYFIRDSVLVTTNKPTANFYTNPLEGIEKLPIYFGNESQNATSYEWDFGNEETSFEPNPTFTYFAEGEYTVTLVAIDDLGCRDTTLRNFTVHPEYFGYVPNSFTPNGDGKNDVFKGSFLGIKKSELYIFNRWGELIYQSTSTRGYWDGTDKNKPSKSDVYIYKYIVEDYSNVTHEYMGHINLIR